MRIGCCGGRTGNRGIYRDDDQERPAAYAGVPGRHGATYELM